MRLLTILDNRDEPYGAEKHAMAVACGAAARGWEVHALFPHTPKTGRLIRDCDAHGVRHHPMSSSTWLRPSSTGWRRHLSRALESARRLGATPFAARDVARVAPDVVQLTLTWPTALTEYLLACGALAVPGLAVFQLAPRRMFVPAAVRRVYALARTRGPRWVAVSEQNRTCLAESFAVPPDEIQVIPNGIDTSRFAGRARSERARARKEICDELSLDPASIIVLTVARVDTQKGCLDLVDAMGAVLRRHPAARFVWVGSGPAEPGLRQAAAARGVGDHLRLAGYRTQVDRYYLAADLFVLPSRAEGGCSSAVREAMLHGVPIVASRAGGIPETLRDGADGVLAPVGDPARLGDAIRWALDHPADMQRFAARAETRIREFPVEAMVESYLDAFESAARLRR